MADEITFYTHPMSRGRMVRWMLEEIGIPYHTEIVGYADDMKTPAYLAVNPMGKVPTIRHGDVVVTESAAILAYLADVFPDAGLAPPANKRGDYYRWLFFAAGPLEAAASNKMFGFELAEGQEKSAGYGSYQDVMSTLEGAVSGGGYIAADHFTAADLYLGSHIGWGMQFGTVEERPGFKEYWALVSDRDACRRATEIDDALMAENSG